MTQIFNCNRLKKKYVHKIIKKKKNVIHHLVGIYVGIFNTLATTKKMIHNFIARIHKVNYTHY